MPSSFHKSSKKARLLLEACLESFRDNGRASLKLAHPKNRFCATEPAHWEPSESFHVSPPGRRNYCGVKQAMGPILQGTRIMARGDSVDWRRTWPLVARTASRQCRLLKSPEPVEARTADLALEPGPQLYTYIYIYRGRVYISTFST